MNSSSFKVPFGWPVRLVFIAIIDGVEEREDDNERRAWYDCCEQLELSSAFCASFSMLMSVASIFRSQEGELLTCK